MHPPMGANLVPSGVGLSGKVALVAAASRGLGRAVADELAVKGASLVLCSRSEEAINQTQKRLRRRPLPGCSRSRPMFPIQMMSCILPSSAANDLGTSIFW
jgi:hypothetical protein